MAYCTIEELASALRLSVTNENLDRLTRCVDAAAEEIDAALDRTDPMPVEASPLVKSDNIYRAVQWFKANDVALGSGGTTETGTLVAPTEPYQPASVVPYKQQWGIA